MQTNIMFYRFRKTRLSGFVGSLCGFSHFTDKCRQTSRDMFAGLLSDQCVSPVLNRLLMLIGSYFR